LAKNPMTVVGRIERCWLFTYHTPIEDALALLPRELSPVEYQGRAFWNIVISELACMRPAGFPAFVGVHYWHAAYRLYVKAKPKTSNEVIEGLYFLRSDCDSSLMKVSGNWLTDFNFHKSPILHTEKDQQRTFTISAKDAPATFVLDYNKPPKLSSSSPFGSIQEAKEFLKYKPQGISVESPGLLNVVRITRDENAWKSRLICVKEANVGFFEGKRVTPEICYEVEPIEYRWNRRALIEVELR
jgi:hypothetical protein